MLQRSPTPACLQLFVAGLVPVLVSCAGEANDADPAGLSPSPGPSSTEPSGALPGSTPPTTSTTEDESSTTPPGPSTLAPTSGGPAVAPNPVNVSPGVTPSPVSPPASNPSTTAPVNTGAPSGQGGSRSPGPNDGDPGDGLGGGPPGVAGLPVSNGGSMASGGAANTAGGASGGGPGMPHPGFDNPVMGGSGTSSERYETAMVSRNDVPFILITNGWGPGFGSHTVSWEGTSFIIEAMEGSAGSMGQPASYPTVFCGKYSVMQVPDCGLPAAIDSLSSLKTGWRWSPNGNAGEYNAAYDIWVGDGTRLQGYLMVWLRDPPGYQPAGSPNMAHQQIEVANVPGKWNVWNGTVNGLPITNWVRAEGDESLEIEFDVMDFLRDADARGLSYPGTHINAVAVGFEIWEGPISNLETVDFYVDPQ